MDTENEADISTISPGLSMLTTEDSSKVSGNTVHATTIAKRKGKELLVPNLATDVLKDLPDARLHLEPSCSNSTFSMKKNEKLIPSTVELDTNQITTDLVGDEDLLHQTHLLKDQEIGYISAPETNTSIKETETNLKIRADWRFLEVPKSLLSEASAVTRSKSKASKGAD
jgi:hypothetical protein